MSDQKPVEINIEQLLIELGLADADDATKKEMAEMFQSIIDAKLKLYLMDSLNEEEAKKIDGLSEDETIKFFEEEKGIDFDALILAIAQESRDEMVQDAAYIQGQIDATFDKDAE
jgi:alkyl hydroperoxide reductase subunit AhpF